MFTRKHVYVWGFSPSVTNLRQNRDTLAISLWYTHSIKLGRVPTPKNLNKNWEDHKMKLEQLTKKYPVIASIVVIMIVTILTEVPIQPIRNILSPVIGRFYGDYLADFIPSALATICLLFAAAKLGLGGKLGLKKPVSWASLFLVWPLVLLSLLNGSEYLFGEIPITFDPILFIIFMLLYPAIGFLEEVLFRGYVQGFLMRRWGNSYRGIFSSVLLASLIFGSAHIANLIMGRSTLFYTVAQLIYAFFFGVFFSALYIRSGSLFPGIFLHMFFDFMGNLDAFTPDAQPRSEFVRSITPEAFFATILVLSPLLFIGLFYLRKSKVQILPVDEQEA